MSYEYVGIGFVEVGFAEVPSGAAGAVLSPRTGCCVGVVFSWGEGAKPVRSAMAARCSAV